MITIRMMLPAEEPQVRQLFNSAHPDRPVRPASWYFAFPTIVAVDDEKVIGFTGFSMGVTAGNVVHMVGHGVAVAPEYQGQGIGHVLVEKRNEIARELEAKFIVVACLPGNRAMEAVFKCNGAEPVGGLQADGQQYYQIAL